MIWADDISFASNGEIVTLPLRSMSRREIALRVDVVLQEGAGGPPLAVATPDDRAIGALVCQARRTGTCPSKGSEIPAVEFGDLR